MARVTTLAEMWWPLMDKPSIETPYCAVCGRTGHLERHHMVPRSAGQLVLPNGRLADKPTITLCGFGNAGGCHGKAHSGRLHFRWVERDVKSGFGEGYLCIHGGHVEYLLLEEPVDRLTALSMPGWRRLRKAEDWGS